MATVIELFNQGALTKLVPEFDDPRQQELRRIYLGPKLVEWINNVLPNLESDRGLETSPNGQFDDLVQVFCSGDTLTFDWHFKPLNYVQDGIWELKTADLRIFGWFHEKGCFIGVIADTKARIVEYKLVTPYSNVEVAPFREALNLDEPKFITGKDPHAVVTDYDYP
jgi:hypothetical protein